MDIGNQEVFTLILSVFLVVMTLNMSAYVNRQRKTLTTFSIASYCYALIYGVIPIYYIFTDKTAPPKIQAAYHTDAQFEVLLVAVIGYIILSLSYFLGSKIKFKKQVTLEKYLPRRKYEWWAYLSFIVGMFGVLIEIQLQGGIMNSIMNIDKLRAFTDSSVKDGTHNPLVFFRMFKPFMIFSYYVFNMLARHTKHPRHRFMSFITFLLTAYIIFINGGRTHIFIFLATVFVGFIIRNKKKEQQKRSKKQIFATILIVAVGIFVLVGFDPIFATITYGVPLDFSSTTNLDSFAFQFSFPYSNMLYVVTHQFSYRYFQDSFNWIISILPSFLTSKIGIPDPTPLYEYNTDLQNTSMVGGGIPDDYLTFGMYQLGYLGIVLSLIFFGIVISQIDKIIQAYKNNVTLKPITLRVIIYIGMIIMYADAEATFRLRYDTILLLYFLYDYRKYNLGMYRPEKNIKKNSNQQFRKTG